MHELPAKGIRCTFQIKKTTSHSLLQTVMGSFLIWKLHRRPRVIPFGVVFLRTRADKHKHIQAQATGIFGHSADKHWHIRAQATGIFRHIRAYSSIFGHSGHLAHAFSCGETPPGWAYSLHAPILNIKLIRERSVIEFYQAVVGMVVYQSMEGCSNSLCLKSLQNVLPVFCNIIIIPFPSPPPLQNKAFGLKLKGFRVAQTLFASEACKVFCQYFVMS